jgi:fructose-1,6-bisphosphatase I
MSTAPAVRQTTFAQHLQAARVDDELSCVLEAVGAAGRILAHEVGRAALSGATGYAGESNATGDDQKKLDVLANDIVLEHLRATGLVAAVVSEELADAQVLRMDESAPFIVCTDPLDGSSNTDINGAIGTIFGVYRRKGWEINAEALLRTGAEQIAAGYIMYGTSTLYVYTAGAGSHGFTLERSLDDFVLSHERIRCPERGRYFSANLGKIGEWPFEIREYFDHVTRRDPRTRRPMSLRYAGALVADLHRNLLEGGVYFYPADADHQSGKLRYLYECAPLAFVVEQAGGRASTGRDRILDLTARSIHERTPLVIGSAHDVELFERFMNGGVRAAA